MPASVKSGAKHACQYELDLNPTFQELAAHHGTAVLPTRKAKPLDKARVEAGVQLVERWIQARLRNQTFFSVAELNREIRRLLEILNKRPFQKIAGTRRRRS